MKKILPIVMIFLLFSCAQKHEAILNKTMQIAAVKSMEKKIYDTSIFKIFTLQRILDPNADLRIYIEGDGRAFVTKYLPSPDPTPTTFFTLNLIAVDNHPNIIYIARPCQYVEDKKCAMRYWTDARFSEEVVAAIDEVLQDFQNKKIQLIGYSGGGAIAKYVAARNSNVMSLRTIAGNIDHEKFTEIHHTSKLEGSLPSDYDLEKLQFMPQIHFVGKKDKVIPLEVAKSYAKKIPIKSCVRIIEIDGATHSDGWKEKWKKLLEIEPACKIG